MFCANLRRRASFVPIVQTLTSPAGLNLRENLLETHDLEIPFRSSDISDDIPNRRTRILLLSPSSCTDTAFPDTLSRIERLSHRTGGDGIAIVFLLSRPQTGFASALTLASTSTIHSTINEAHLSASNAHAEGLFALSKLQAELLLHSTLSAIPVLPLSSLQGLTPLVQQYVHGLAHPIRQSESAKADVLELLAECTVNPPLSQQTAYVVTDLVPSIKALARCAALDRESRGNEGEGDGGGTKMATWEGETDVAREQMANLRDFLGEEDVEGMMAFWREEWTAK